MEPLSVIGAASSIISIVDIATRCISSLRSLQQQWKGADITVSLLVGQLTTLKTALDQIYEWMTTILDGESQHHQLVMDLDASLKSCKLLVSFIDGHITSLKRDNTNRLIFTSKAKTMWKDSGIQGCANHLHHQTTALNLLLTAVNCRTLADQRDMIMMPANRSIIDQVWDDTSSLICLRDSTSLHIRKTSYTDGSSLLSRRFGFDHEILASKVYQGHIRSLVRRTLGKGKKSDEASLASVIQDSHSSLNSDKIRSKNIDWQLVRDKRRTKTNFKVLVLGPRKVGQFATFGLAKLFEISLDERRSYKPVILSHLANAMNIIFHEFFRVTGFGEACSISEGRILASWLASLSPNDLPLEIAIIMRKIWASDLKFSDRFFKSMKCWQADEYYLNSIDRIGDPGYMPTDLDIILSKQKPGMIEFTHPFELFTCQFIYPACSNEAEADIEQKLLVTGRLNKRLSFFDNADALIFEANIADYDRMIQVKQSIGPPKLISHLEVALSYFQSLCTLTYMERKPISIILSGVTKFLRDFEFSRFKQSFPDYQGRKDARSGARYIMELFLSLDRSNKRDIYRYCLDANKNSDIRSIIQGFIDDYLTKQSSLLSH